MDFLMGFVLGLMVGAAALIIYVRYAFNKVKKKLTEATAKVKESEANLSLEESIFQRMQEVARITEAQLELRAQAEMPSKNSLHSRHKNGIIGQLQELEYQKLSILRTVLGDGHNPTVEIIRNGVKEKITLEEYVVDAEAVLADMGYSVPPSKQPSSESSGPRKAGKFIIYNGGKGEGETTH